MKAMKPRVYAMLVALAGGARHGYGLKKEVAEASGGAIRLGPATLYRTLAALEADGLIEETEERPVPEEEDDERRRYYRLTEAGREAMVDETARLEGLVRRARHSGAGGGA